MRAKHEPVSMGSPRFTTVDTGAFRITEAWFAPGTALEPHSHDRSIVSVMLGGSFVTKIHGHTLDCVASTMWTEPCEERHANYVGTGGAHVLVTQPDPDVDPPREFRGLLSDVTSALDPVIVSDARRASAELAAPDEFSPLVLESVVTLIMARAARLREPRSRARGVPDWLLRARDILHDCFREPVALERLAAAAGVTKWHLAREFRHHFHASLGEYARALRVNRALEQLARADAPISEIAFEAGYADQSHFTRACKAATGLSPGAYRRRLARMSS